jgi:FMN phosphatase YigB (HAD superfamily)
MPTASGHKNLLLTFDAFSTLFHPRCPVHDQYASIAYSFGLSSSVVTPVKLAIAFKKAFREQSKRFPNYGRQQTIMGRYGGPRQWWTDVVRGSFAELSASPGLVEAPADLPEGMVDEVLNRFASRKGYALYDDVIRFFDWLKVWRNNHPKAEGPKEAFDRIVVGVISNSDDRVPAVLKSLGLGVGNVRADQDASTVGCPGFEEWAKDATDMESSSLPNAPKINDIDMVITSYEAGEEKPHRLIFDVAKRQACKFVPNGNLSSAMDGSWVCLHVGDDYEKDYKGAIAAGWSSQLLSRDSPQLGNDEQRGLAVIRTLSDLIPILQRYGSK